MSIKDTYNLDELDKKSIIYELLERELQFKEALIYLNNMGMLKLN